MSETITNLQEEVRNKIDQLYGQGTVEAETAWEHNQSRLNTLRPGDDASNYVGRPDIQWGIIVDELDAAIELNAGHHALGGANTHLFLVDGSAGTLVEGDLAEAV